jgi:hypothetical protein
MKKFSFGTVFGLTAVAVAVFALMVGGCEQINDMLNRIPDSMTAEVADAADLQKGFDDPDVTEIKITENLEAAVLSVPKGVTKVITIPGGKETSIGSLELAAGSHVTVAGPDIPAEEQLKAQAGLGAFAVARSETGGATGPAILVIWDHFKIADGATFELKGWVRLVFRSTATAEVNGKLTAEAEGSIVCKGTEDDDENATPTFTGTGTVKTGKDAEEKVAGNITAEDIPDAEDIELVYTEPPAGGEEAGEGGEPPVKLAINSTETGIMEKGTTRQFSVSGAGGETVTWSVEGLGGDDVAGDTAISADGLLTVAEDETNITLVVKAAAGGEEATATVKVKGWKKINLNDYFYDTDNNGGGVDGIVYGNDRWIAIGGYGKIAYSDDGENWQGATSSIADGLYKVIYDGLAGGKKFIAVGEEDTIIYSSDGETWTAATVISSTTEYDIKGITYGNGKFIAVDYKPDNPAVKTIGVLISTDGTRWTRTTQDFSSVLTGNNDKPSNPQIAFGNDTFVCVLGGFGLIAKSTDGSTWSVIANGRSDSVTGYSDTTLSFKAVDRLFNIIYAEDKFIAVGYKSRIAIADNTAASWSIAQIPGAYTNGGSFPSFIIYANGKYIANPQTTMSGNKELYINRSLTGDGSTDWAVIQDVAVSGMGVFNGVAYGDGKFIAVCVDGSDFKGVIVAHEETLD